MSLNNGVSVRPGFSPGAPLAVNSSAAPLSPLMQPNTDTPSVDYEAVEITSEEPSEYHYTERRAELLSLVQEAGHPRALNQSHLADRYGVSQSQISQDLDRLATYIREQLADRDRRALTTETILQRCIQSLLDEGEYRAAAKTALEREEWLTNFHDLEELYAQVNDASE